VCARKTQPMENSNNEEQKTQEHKGSTSQVTYCATAVQTHHVLIYNIYIISRHDSQAVLHGAPLNKNATHIACLNWFTYTIYCWFQQQSETADLQFRSRRLPKFNGDYFVQKYISDIFLRTSNQFFYRQEPKCKKCPSCNVEEFFKNFLIKIQKG